MRRMRRTLLAGLVGIVLSSCATVKTSVTQSIPAAPPSEPIASVSSPPLAPEEVVPSTHQERCISAEQAQLDRRSVGLLYDLPQEVPEEITDETGTEVISPYRGSGFFLDDHYLLTALHVARNMPTIVSLYSPDKGIAHVTVIAEDSQKDLALVYVDPPRTHNLPRLPLTTHLEEGTPIFLYKPESYLFAPEEEIKIYREMAQGLSIGDKHSEVTQQDGYIRIAGHVIGPKRPIIVLDYNNYIHILMLYPTNMVSVGGFSGSGVIQSGTCATLSGIVSLVKMDYEISMDTSQEIIYGGAANIVGPKDIAAFLQTTPYAQK